MICSRAFRTVSKFCLEAATTAEAATAAAAENAHIAVTATASRQLSHFSSHRLTYGIIIDVNLTVPSSQYFHWPPERMPRFVA